MSLSIAISSAAFALSLFTFLYQRSNQRKELLLRIYEDLLEPEQQRGRRLLFELVENQKPISSLAREDLDCINHSLASLNVLGYLYRRSYIPKGDAMDLWGVPAARAWQAARVSGMLELRDAQEKRMVWPHFRMFADKAYAKFYGNDSSSPRERADLRGTF